MPNLYQLATSYKEFYDYLDAALENDEMTEDDLQLYFDTLDSVQENFEQKAENVVKFLKNIEGDIESYKSEKLRLEKKQKYLQNKYDGLKRWLKDSLEANNIDKVSAGMFKLRLQKNPASVTILDQDKIPAQYITKTEISFDKKGLLQDIQSGQKIAGAIIAPETKHIRFS